MANQFERRLRLVPNYDPPIAQSTQAPEIDRRFMRRNVLFPLTPMAFHEDQQAITEEAERLATGVRDFDELQQEYQQSMRGEANGDSN